MPLSLEKTALWPRRAIFCAEGHGRAELGLEWGAPSTREAWDLLSLRAMTLTLACASVHRFQWQSPLLGHCCPSWTPAHPWPSSIRPLPSGQRALKMQKTRSQLPPAPAFHDLGLKLESPAKATLTGTSLPHSCCSPSRVSAFEHNQLSGLKVSASLGQRRRHSPLLC